MNLLLSVDFGFCFDSGSNQSTFLESRMSAHFHGTQIVDPHKETRILCGNVIAVEGISMYHHGWLREGKYFVFQLSCHYQNNAISWKVSGVKNDTFSLALSSTLYKVRESYTNRNFVGLSETLTLLSNIETKNESNADIGRPKFKIGFLPKTGRFGISRGRSQGKRFEVLILVYGSRLTHKCLVQVTVIRIYNVICHSKKSHMVSAARCHPLLVFSQTQTHTTYNPS